MQVIDLVVLIGAAACGLALIRLVDRAGGLYVFTQMPESRRRQWELDYGEPVPIRDWWLSVVLASDELSAAAIVLAAAVCGLRFRAPRPRFKRLFLQGGMAATATALLVHLFLLILRLPELMHWKRSWSFEEYPAPSAWLTHLLDEAILPTGLSIVVVWFSLWLSRRWRWECSWIDQLGIALGAYWIYAAALLSFLW